MATVSFTLATNLGVEYPFLPLFPLQAAFRSALSLKISTRFCKLTNNVLFFHLAMAYSTVMVAGLASDHKVSRILVGVVGIIQNCCHKSFTSRKS